MYRILIGAGLLVGDVVSLGYASEQAGRSALIVVLLASTISLWSWADEAAERLFHGGKH